MCAGSIYCYAIIGLFIILWLITCLGSIERNDKVSSENKNSGFSTSELSKNNSNTNDFQHGTSISSQINQPNNAKNANNVTIKTSNNNNCELKNQPNPNLEIFIQKAEKVATSRHNATIEQLENHMKTESTNSSNQKVQFLVNICAAVISSQILESIEEALFKTKQPTKGPKSSLQLQCQRLL